MNVKTRIEYALYTINHKKAFLKVEKELLGKNTIRGYIHDIEKPFCYILFGKEITSKLHKKIAIHHNPKNKNDLIESIIDFECARHTKEDKPLNARDFIYKNKKDMVGEYGVILEELGL